MSAREYVNKEESYLGDRFSFGTQPISRNKKHDWERVWSAARDGRLEEIPASIRVQSYRTLKQITSDNLKPGFMEREVFAYVGSTGVGKTKQAWDEMPHAYPKDPSSKFWCGYSGEEHVIIDEFRGQISIGHLLRWCDRYPVIVETKGGATILKARRIVLTSNLPLIRWYPELDEETFNALKRRIKVINFKELNKFDST